MLLWVDFPHYPLYTHGHLFPGLILHPLALFDTCPRLGKDLLFLKALFLNLHYVCIGLLPSVLFGLSACCSTFIGIAVHNITKNNSGSSSSIDLAAGIRQDASGLLGTTALLSDLVCLPFVKLYCCFCPLPIVKSDSQGHSWDRWSIGPDRSSIKRWSRLQKPYVKKERILT